jgi:hypothetical protein
LNELERSIDARDDLSELVRSSDVRGEFLNTALRSVDSLGDEPDELMPLFTSPFCADDV